jgi:hypothetical protein
MACRKLNKHCIISIPIHPICEITTINNEKGKQNLSSLTQHAWHVPYTMEVFENLRNMFPDLE